VLTVYWEAGVVENAGPSRCCGAGLDPIFPLARDSRAFDDDFNTTI